MVPLTDVDLLAFDIVLTDIEELKINFEDLQILEEVGRGGYATVFKGMLNGEVVAVKRLGNTFI